MADLVNMFQCFLEDLEALKYIQSSRRSPEVGGHATGSAEHIQYGPESRQDKPKIANLLPEGKYRSDGKSENAYSLCWMPRDSADHNMAFNLARSRQRL